jgi:4-hydroxyphenylacetate decarboxylase small subunit
MSDLVLHHSDCRNFCTLDVAKGLCRRTNELVQVDADSCTCFLELPKCKFCANYAATEDNLGICKAEKDEPWAYPEMIAVTCELFAAA